MKAEAVHHCNTGESKMGVGACGVQQPFHEGEKDLQCAQFSRADLTIAMPAPNK
jgi:hypothetical protein